MRSYTQRFNGGFGINLVRLTDPVERRRDVMKAKAILSVPLLGGGLATIMLMERSVQRGRGNGAAGLRGILYGSIVGIPVGVALDIVGTVMQVKALVQAKRAAKREQELRPVGF